MRTSAEREEGKEGKKDREETEMERTSTLECTVHIPLVKKERKAIKKKTQ